MYGVLFLLFYFFLLKKNLTPFKPPPSLGSHSILYLNGPKWAFEQWTSPKGAIYAPGKRKIPASLSQVQWQVLAHSVSAEALFLTCRQLTSCCVFTWREKEQTLVSLHLRALSPLWEPHPHDLIQTSQMPQPQIPSHWGLELQNGLGQKTTQLIATTIPSIGQWQVCSRWLPNMLWEKKKNKGREKVPDLFPLP